MALKDNLRRPVGDVGAVETAIGAQDGAMVDRGEASGYRHQT